MKILIINGPNLQNIGEREPNIYGSICFDDFFEKLCAEFSNAQLTYVQTHIEGEIIRLLSSAKEDSYDGVVLNAGAYSHSSIGIYDAVKASGLPVIGVHISNVYEREPFRNNNFFAKACKGIITGFGVYSYKLAIISLTDLYYGKKKYSSQT